jgi:hypothetical protein
MSILPGTESWSKEALLSRIDFLMTCAHRARDLSIMLGRNGTEAQESPEGIFLGESTVGSGEIPSIVDSLSEAAELSFCEDMTGRGLGYLREAVQMSMLQVPFTSLATLTRISVCAAVLGSARVYVSSDGITVRVANADSMKGAWGQLGTTEQIARSLPILVLAALASGPAKTCAPILFNSVEDDRTSMAWLAALASPEFTALGLLGFSRQRGSISFREEGSESSWVSAEGSLIQMERSYESRVQLMQRDSYHWAALRARAELIDWRLLVLHVALIRRKPFRPLEILPKPGPAAAFIRDLAREMVFREDKEESKG